MPYITGHFFDYQSAINERKVEKANGCMCCLDLSAHCLHMSLVAQLQDIGLTIPKICSPPGMSNNSSTALQKRSKQY